MRAYGFSVSIFLYVEGAYYLLATISTTIYSIICGYKVLKGLRKSASLTRNPRTDRVLTGTYYILGSLVGLAGFVAMIAIMGITDLLFQTAWNYVILWTVCYTIQQMIATMLLAAFHVPKSFASASSKGFYSSGTRGSKDLSKDYSKDYSKDGSKTL